MRAIPFLRFEILFAIYLWLSLLVLFPVAHHYVTILSPLYELSATKVSAHYFAPDFDVDIRGPKTVVTFTARTKLRHVAGQLVREGRRASSGTLASYGITHLVLLLAPLLAWYILKRQRPLSLGVLAAGAIVFIELVDVPFVLVGSVEDLVLATADRYQADTNLVVFMMHFYGGGRFALPLLAAGTIITLHQRLPSLYRAAEPICVK